MRWGTAALCVAIIVLYAASFRWWGRLSWWRGAGDAWILTLDRGWAKTVRTDLRLGPDTYGRAAWEGEPTFTGGRIDRYHAPLEKQFRWNHIFVPAPGGTSGISWYNFPLWPLALAAGTVAAGLTLAPLLRRRSRRRRGACTACGYSRAGLKDESPCPECGAPAGGAGVGGQTIAGRRSFSTRSA